MTQSVPTTLKQAIWTRFHNKYGDITIEYTRFVWEADDTFTIEFTISHHDRVLAQYSGKAAYDALGLVLDVTTIQ